ncbi:MAG: TetR family transcriptional regulator C-terminal domain-containing protein [Colwellia polaris]|jgi:TetR/AcrR family transcriptional repressor of nem operon|uniref:acrylate utilization transcriptional regulator AcuR n=1 Tax=Colwellia polaris TaxID=326537 RepID=UPI000A173851|nr:TetR/AcrR family transcriptional regulator [Colwellia polaris]|tara:strand:- start:1153 stop:1785 length:633 start_codon:yes stop_codon:yes gene_type:complete
MNKDTNLPKRGRPAKSGRDSNQTKQLLIQSGVEYFTEFGFAASGIDLILKKVSVPKGSFYHYFSSKEAFGLAVIEEYSRYFAKKLDIHLLNENNKPLIRIANFAIDAKEGMTRYNFKRGCLIGNLEQEVTQLPESHRLQLLATFDDWQRKMAVCLQLAQQENAIAPSLDCNALASFFWLGWEGAIAKSKLTQNLAPIDGFIDTFLLLVKK